MKIKKGYTLIEILMVMAIIAILMALSAVAFLSARTTARDAKRKTDLEQIRGALETYKADHNVYPGSQSTPSVSAGYTKDTLTTLVDNNYIAVLPSDPSSTANYSYVPLSSGYALCTHLENAGTSTAPDCSTDCGTAALNKMCNYEVKNP